MHKSQRYRLGSPIGGSPASGKFVYKQLIQHDITLLAHWMHGHNEKEIGELMGVPEVDVRRDLERALDVIERRRSCRSGEKPAVKAPAEDQMPATLCSQCNGAIPAGECRITVIAAMRDRRHGYTGIDRDTLETTWALTFCRNCAMAMPQFIIVNDFQLDVERHARRMELPAVPREDVLVPWRADTGRGEEPDKDDERPAAKAAKEGAELGSSEDEEPGRADEEAIEFSGWNHQRRPEVAVATQPPSAKEVARQRLASFLKDPCSRSKLRPITRTIAQHYTDGLTQFEIAKRTGMDQSSVSRTIQAALKLACGA